ncbi:MAG: 3'(2'),5'-bisphosphate nucleotidase CysQ [Deltaproteobacteria bacterium]|nr:3'(2'),5'-bisphosphate nucleotidase CysQ [Deltaproteobacteria bacterium]
MDITADAQLEAMIDIARSVSARVAELHRQHRSDRFEVELKDADEPVTRADREANELICEALAARFPAAAIVAEESRPDDPGEIAELLGQKEVFFVDPIDGTREFVDGRGEFAVMIGLAEGGRATAGVVALPAVGLLLAGRVGTRALAETTAGERRLVGVSDVSRFDQATMVASRSHRPAIVEPICRRLGVCSLQPCGSVGVKVARLLTGSADLYVHGGPGLKLWDSCAPEAVLEAAGGRLSDFDGQPIRYVAGNLHLTGGLAATNGHLHPGVLSAVGWAQREADRLGG